MLPEQAISSTMDSTLMTPFMRFNQRHLRNVSSHCQVLLGRVDKSSMPLCKWCQIENTAFVSVSKKQVCVLLWYKPCILNLQYCFSSIDVFINHPYVLLRQTCFNDACVVMSKLMPYIPLKYIQSGKKKVMQTVLITHAIIQRERERESSF